MMDGWELRQQLVAQVNEPTEQVLRNQAERLGDHEEHVRRFWAQFECRCGHKAGAHVSYGYGLDRRLGACLVDECECVEFEDVR